MSLEMVSRGARVFLSDIDGSELQRLSKELKMPAAHCNVTSEEEVTALARAAVDTFGAIDMWINNAGIWMPYAPVENLNLNRARDLMSVNYFGLASCTIEALKHMKPRGKGTILNILSVRALKGKALGAAYSASKFAAEGFLQAVRDEVKDSGISILNVYPYRIKTGLFGQNKHEDYESSMDSSDVAQIIASNLSEDKPANTLQIWSATDVRKTNNE